MKTSKFVQLDSQVLMEYIYNDSNLKAENYIITNNKDNDTISYSANNNTGSVNRYENQYFTIDPITNKTAQKNEEIYNFLQNKEYTQTLPIRHDRIKLHLPTNYNFADNSGCYLRVYVMDYDNNDFVNIVQYYFDKQNQTRFNRELQLDSVGSSINGRVWGKFIEIDFPSPYTVSRQRVNNLPTSNSINSNLDPDGISTTSPIMVEFGFINSKETIGNITTYMFSNPYQTSVPLTPEFENLGLRIETAEEGDWFNIFGTYNKTASEFNRWIIQSRNMGKNYYVEYIITIFEENNKGKETVIRVNEDFSEPIEYRPIIKYSTTTASIDVTMRIVDRVDDSIITRRASYGMLPNELSKYSRSLVKINVANNKAPVIYNMRNGGNITDAFDGLNTRALDSGFFEGFQPDAEVIRVPYPVLVNVNNVLARTDNALIDGDTWKGFGKLKLVIEPFDNIIKFKLGQGITNDKVDRINLLEMGTLNLYFKNFNNEVKTNLYRQSEENDLERGVVLFKLNKSSVNSVRKIYQSGVNMFYITSTNEETNETSVMYEGTFIMSDSVEYVDDLAINYQRENEDVEIRRDNNQETAIVTRRRINPENNN